MPQKKVLVTGDTVIDWFELPGAPQSDLQNNWRRYMTARQIATHGGALLL